jgi:hypothetical protein
VSDDFADDEKQPFSVWVFADGRTITEPADMELIWGNAIVEREGKQFERRLFSFYRNAQELPILQKRMNAAEYFMTPLECWFCEVGVNWTTFDYASMWVKNGWPLGDFAFPHERTWGGQRAVETNLIQQASSSRFAWVRRLFSRKKAS